MPALCALLLAATTVRADEPATLPKPGVGLHFKSDTVAVLRAEVQKPPCQAIYQELIKQADAALTNWPWYRRPFRVTELAPQLPHLTMEGVPDKYATKGGAEALEHQ